MTWTILLNSTTTEPNEVNDDFYHVRQGSITPKSGASMVSTDDTVNLGSDSNRWNNVYGNTLSDFSGLTWENVSYTELSSVTSRIDVTGLDGDSDFEYMIIGSVFNETITSLNMHINGDSVSNYGYQKINLTGSITTESRDSNTSFIIGNMGNATSTSDEEGLMFYGIVNALSGKVKPFIHMNSNDCINSNVNSIDENYSIYNGTSTLTSIVITSTEDMNAGSFIGVWRRGK